MSMRTFINTVCESTDPTARPGFAAWFKQSKAVAYDGSPLPVFHGTDAPHFDTFDDSEIMWFAQYESTADTYKAKSGEGEERIITAYLSVQNPFEVPHDIDMSQEIDLEEALELINEHLHDPLSADELGMEEDFYGNGFEIINSEEFRDAMVRRGHDGICVLELDDPTWGVFRSNQIMMA